MEWYRKASKQGNAEAQFNLGIMYEIGRGVTQDYAGAAKLYRDAAEQGHALAQFNLGVAYEYGRGMTQDYAEAVGWYRKAAWISRMRTSNAASACARCEVVRRRAPRSTRWWRPPAVGTSWRPSTWPGWLSRTRRPGRYRAGLPSEPGRGFCQDFPLLA